MPPKCVVELNPPAPAWGSTGSLSRRGAIRTIAGASLAFSLGACGTRSSTPRVVLYSSVDDYLLRELVPMYQTATGVTVDLVGDTEATKSTGLAERIIAERARPRGDVWWSSEPFYSIRLAREGLLEPGAARAALGDAMASQWPAGLLASDGAWAGLACRARVIVYRTTRVTAAEVPRTLGDLTDPKWRGRVAMARPEFGTTRGHVASLIEANGPEPVEAWLRALMANGLKVYSGNSTVVRAIAQGEADLGLTDTDDVWSGQRNGWEVEAAYESDSVNCEIDPQNPPFRSETPLASPGPLVLPNSAGLIKGGPNPAEGRRLLAWILSGEAEHFLARSESRNIPVHPDVARQYPALRVPLAWEPNLERVAGCLDEAASIAARVLDS